MSNPLCCQVSRSASRGALLPLDTQRHGIYRSSEVRPCQMAYVGHLERAVSIDDQSFDTLSPPTSKTRKVLRVPLLGLTIPRCDFDVDVNR